MKCEKHSKDVHSHHLDGWNWCKEKRYEVSTGVCLCSNCHKNFHSLYGFGYNTKEQFKEWIEKPLEQIMDYNGDIITARKIICLETKEIGTCKDFGKDHIYKVCNGKANQYRGKHYVWYEEYLQMSEKDILDKLSLDKKIETTKVVCIERKLLFESEKDGAKYFNNNSHISEVLAGKIETFAGYHWCKLEEYDNDTEKLYKVPHEECINSNRTGGKGIVCIEKKIVFKNLKHIKEYFNLDYGSRIYSVINKLSQTAYGLHWCHLRNYNEDLNELIYV